MENPSGYINRAFEFGREFFYIWTVNFKFLPEEMFLSKKLALGLLVAHLTTLILYGFTKWTRVEGGPLKLIFGSRGETKKMTAERMLVSTHR
jgi:alpha-1,3-mannosyltransferase